MIKVIETTDEKHKEVSQRWMSLANRKCHVQVNSLKGADVWGVIVICLAIQKRWEEKFGVFCPKSESIKRGEI